MLNPLAWINDKLQEFLALPPQLDSLLRKAQEIFQSEANARFRGPTPTVQTEREVAAIRLINDITEIKRDWSRVRGKMQLGEESLSGPLVVIGIWGVAITAIVIGITSIFRRTTAAERAVDYLITTGAPPDTLMDAVLATQQEKREGFDHIVAEFAGVLKIAGLVGLAFIAIPLLAPRRR